MKLGSIKHLFDICVYNWNKHWGDGLILVLLAVCILILLLRERKNKAAMLLLGYSLILAGLFFFPVSAGIIRKAIGKQVYWRVLWVVPLVPFIALGLSSAVMSGKWKWFRGILAAAATAAVIVTGENAFSVENFERLPNPEQVPEVVVSIDRQIRLRSGGEDVLAAADDYIASYLRVYDPSIKMIYGRIHNGAISHNAVWIYKYINTWPYTNYKRLRRRAKLEGLDYIIMREPSDEGKKILARGGFRQVSTEGDYAILENRRKRKSVTVQSD